MGPHNDGGQDDDDRFSDDELLAATKRALDLATWWVHDGRTNNPTLTTDPVLLCRAAELCALLATRQPPQERLDGALGYRIRCAAQGQGPVERLQAGQQELPVGAWRRPGAGPP